jgi:hypothetical protein
MAEGILDKRHNGGKGRIKSIQKESLYYHAENKVGKCFKVG